MSARSWNYIIFSAILICPAGFANTLAAQRSLGVVFTEASYRSVLLIEPAGGKKGLDFPKQVSLRPFCPAPGFQHEVSSCTAFAVGYGSMSAMAALKAGISDSAALAATAFSAAFIYNQVKRTPGDCQEGIGVEETLRFLKDKGNCRYNQFDTTRSCVVQPDSLLLRSADSNQIRDFAAVLPYGANSAQVIDILINYLRDSVPVIAVIRACERFIRPEPGERVWSRLPNEPEIGLHCLLVTGYDETERSFEVLSSWGADWADKGYYRINWNDMGEVMLAGYVLYPNQISADAETRLAHGIKPGGRTASAPGLPTLQAFTLDGEIDLVRVEPDGTAYAPEPVRYDANSRFYVPAAGAFPSKTLYQLLSSGTAGGQYIYVFSCDARGKVQAHYPKPFFSALSPGRQAVVTVPSIHSALRLDTVGDDLVCILYSEQEIGDFDARLRTLGACTRTNFEEKVRISFGDILVDPAEGNHIEYLPNRIKARAEVSAGRGVAVPVFLWLRAE